MVAWARLVANCRRAGVHRTVKLTDALIAATAVDLGLSVVTRDDDYEQMGGPTRPFECSGSEAKGYLA